MSVFDNRPTADYINRVRLFLHGKTPDNIVKKEDYREFQALEQHYKIFIELQKLDHAVPTRREAVTIGNMCSVASTRVFKTANAIIRVKQESHVQIIQ